MKILLSLSRGTKRLAQSVSALALLLLLPGGAMAGSTNTTVNTEILLAFDGVLEAPPYQVPLMLWSLDGFNFENLPALPARVYDKDPNGNPGYYVACPGCGEYWLAYGQPGFYFKSSAPGIYTFVITFYNYAGDLLATTTVIVTVTGGNTAPAFVGSTTSLTVRQNAGATNLNQLLHVSDPDSGQTLTWSQSSGPAHGTLSFTSCTATSGGADIAPGGLATYTPAEGYLGSDSFTVRVSDGTDAATRTITVSVVDDIPPVVTIGLPSASLTRHGPVSYLVTYTDANLGSISLAAGNITVNATGTAGCGTVSVSGTGNTRLVSLASISGDGTLGISIPAGTAVDTSSNPALAAGPSLTFNVDNTAPVITSAPATNGTYGVALDYVITASGAPLTYGCVELPAWLTLNSTTGLLHGNSPEPGVFHLMMSATDAAGNSGAAPLDITIAKAIPIVSAWPNASQIMYGQALSASTLSGGAASADGTFGFDAPTTVLAAGTPSVPATFTPADTNNYAAVSGSVSLLVAKAALEVTGVDQTRAYGRTNAVWEATYTGFVAGDTSASLAGVLAFSFQYTNDVDLPEISTNTPAGTYLVIPGGLSSDNYALTFNPGTLSITQAVLTVTALDTNRVYGSTNPAFAASISEFVNEENESVLTGTLSYSCLNGPSPVDATTGPGTYPIHASGYTATNYSITYQDGTLTILKAALDITANSASRVYGSANPTLGATMTGFVNGEDTNVLGGALSLTTAAETNSPVGPYTITPSGLSSANYDLVYHTGALTVTAAPLLVSVSNAARLYGQTNPVFAGSLSGVVNNDSLNATFSSAATADSPVGHYAIYPVFADPDLKLANYNTTTNLGDLQITPAQVTVRADDLARGYGETNPVLSVTYAGLTNSDTTSVIAGTPTVTTSADTNSVAGTYDIVVDTTPLSALNYTFAGANGQLTVTQAVLLVSADNQSRLYGETNPVLTATITGFVNGETTNVVAGAPGLTTTADVASPVGAYEILAELGTLNATNYSFNFTNGTLTVGQALLCVSADNQQRSYGAANPSLSYHYSGFLSGDTAEVLSGEPAVSTMARTNTAVGTYAITVSQGTLNAPNYALAFSNATFTVTPAPLTVTADDQTRTYGATNPALTLSYSGFVNGEDSTVLTALSVAHTEATMTSPAGDYLINVTGGSAANYTLSLTPGRLHITKAALSATADNQQRQYGQENPQPTISYSGFVNGEDAGAVTAPRAQTAAIVTSPVGSYPISLSGGSAQNYELTLFDGTLVINPATLQARADNQRRAYGAANPTLTISYSGFLNGDDLTTLASFPSAATEAMATSPPGAYPITVTGGSALNYTLVPQAGVLMVQPALLTVRADNQQRAYGATNPVWTASISGFANSQNSDLVNGTPVLSTSARTNSPVGDYEILIDVSGLSTPNYTFQGINGVLVVTQAVLLVSADNQNRFYGQTNPVLTATVTGFVNGETNDVLSGAPDLATTAEAASPAGIYDIVPSLGSLAATNYSFNFSNGTLTVAKAWLSVVAENQQRSYGAANPALTYHYCGFLPGEDASSVTGAPAVGTPAGTNSVVGTYDITIGPGTLGSGNYAFAFSNAMLTINPAPLIAIADNQTRAYGAANPTLTVSYSGFVNGENTSVLTSVAAASTAAASETPPGTYPIVLGGGTAQNYSISFVNGTLRITKAQLIAAAASHRRRYGAANPALNISYSGFVNYQDASVLLNPPLATTIANCGSAVGNYAITLAGGTDPNYEFLLVDGTVEVTPAQLTVTAESFVRAYGAPNPAFTGTIIGVLNEDDLTPTYTCTATISSPAGTYPIMAGLNGSAGVIANYNVSLVDGTLTVTALSLGTNDGFYVIGEAPVQLDANAMVNGGSTPSFADSTLTVAATTNAAAEDVLAVQVEGSGPGQISIEGGWVAYGGAPFATVEGGSGSAPLLFQLNANASADALTALLRRITFATSDTNTDLRVFLVQLAYAGTTASAQRRFTLDRPPVAVDDEITAANGLPLTIPFSQLLSNDYDLDQDPLTVVPAGSTSAHGAQLTFTGSAVDYIPSSAAMTAGEDRFACLVQDGRGGQAVGMVTLKFIATNWLHLDLSSVPTSGAKLQMGGIPGKAYLIQASADLVDWEDLHTVTATATGLIELRDQDAKNHSCRFYRIALQ